MKNNYFIYILFIVFTFPAFSQSKIDYDSDSKWFWGLNYGATWHTTDVKYQINHGWGLTIGKSFNYDYRKVVSFDIRGRFLTGNWYGQNVDSTSIVSDYEGIYDAPSTDYKDSFGYSIDNFKSTINRLAIELVIHANRIKEATKFDPYIFGGVGFTWSTSRTDLLNASNHLYDYTNELNSTQVNLNNLRDKNYETTLSTHQPIFMPSLGFGLGYQIGKRVSIGIEHKSTFTQNDHFDGIVKTSKYTQDIYHYTSAFIRFQLKSRKNQKDIEYFNTEVIEEIKSDPPVEEPKLPIVTITNPLRNSENVTNPNFVLTATIENIKNRDNIEFLQDSSVNYNFTYDLSTKQFKSNVLLHKGENRFLLKGTNQNGSDYKTRIIIFQKETARPPLVTFTIPERDSIELSVNSCVVKTSILNVTEKSQVLIKLNNQLITDFVFENNQYSPNSHLVSFQTILREGKNDISVKATNNEGVDEKSIVIFFKPLKNKILPVVKITNPSKNPFLSTSNSYDLVASVLNVEGKQNIEVFVNNHIVEDFTYDLVSKIVRVKVKLLDGDNIVLIKASNNEGEAKDDQILSYITPCNKPTLALISSSSPNNSSTTNESVSFTLLSENIQDQSQIKVFLNQNLIPFIYDPITKQIFVKNCILILGINSFDVILTNSCGNISFNYKITKEVIQNSPPVITFINPSSCPSQFNLGQNTIKGFVSNVRKANEVKIFVNNQEIINYSNTFSNGGMNFEFVINVTSDIPKYSISVRATNISELITNSCLIEAVKPNK